MKRTGAAREDAAREDTAAEQTGERDSVWYLPAGAARGERNRNRARGWIAAVALAVLAWGVIAAVIALIVALLR